MPGGPGGAGGGFGGGGFGQFNPEAMVDRMMAADTDKDGKLSKEEVLKYFESNRGPGGGRARDGDRPGRPDSDGKDRPKRPE